VPASKLLFWGSLDTLDWVLRCARIVAPWLAGARTPAGRYCDQPAPTAALPLFGRNMFISLGQGKKSIEMSPDMIDLIVERSASYSGTTERKSFVPIKNQTRKKDSAITLQ
jgi:hypothetical protein